ncbi:MAG: hypothetical protein ACREC6_01890, partial [Hyphomicrobiaceae bacterium]
PNLSPVVDAVAHHELVGTYPSEDRPGLLVFVPTPEYMLSMKPMAMRIGPGGAKDLDDILNLMQVVGLDDKAKAIDFAARFYPEARIGGKLRMAIDNLWQQSRNHRAIRSDEPPRYLGRTGPARES